MYFKIANSKGNKYLQLVESYRNELGKPRQRLIANLCNISKRSDEEILKLCQSFLRALGVEKIIFLDDLTAEESYDYGDVLPVVAVWQQLKLGKIIDRCVSKRVKIDTDKASLIMVTNKFVDPQSKLGAWLWYDRSVFKFSQEFEHLPPKDKGLLHKVLKDLKKCFGIRHCIFVGDRCMVSRINLETIKGHEYDYIMGIRRHNSRIVRALLPFIKQKPTNEVIEIKQEKLDDKKLKQELTTKTRFVIGFNEKVQQQVRQNRENKFSDFKEFLEQLPLEGTLEEISDSKTKVISYLTQKRLKRYFSVSMEKTETDGHYRLLVDEKPDAIEEENLIDWHFFIQTEVKEQQLNDNEVITAYKSLKKLKIFSGF